MWQKTILQNLCEITSSKRIYAADYQSEGVPFFRGKEIIEKHKGNLEVSTELFISEDKFLEIKRRFGAPQAGDLLLTSVGTLGVPYVVKPNEEFYFKDGNLTWFRYFKNFDSQYLYYWLISPQGKAQLKKCTIGSSQPAFTIVLLKDMEIQLPPFPVQRRIAGILSAYNDLIENNLRRIKILEEMAQTLYREWFVNFRFPGYQKIKMVNSPGKIPEGWEVSTIGKESRNFDRMRKPLSKMERAKRTGPYPYYGAATVFDHIDDYIFDGVYLLIAEDGSVVTSDRKPVLQFVSGKFWANNHTHVLQGKEPISTEFLHLVLSQVDISGYITGAAQPKITQENLNRIPILVPSSNLLTNFNEIVQPIYRSIVIMEEKNQFLRQTRDLLLPKLISGELDVSELGITIPEANA